jgi:hypothetical protein
MTIPLIPHEIRHLYDAATTCLRHDGAVPNATRPASVEGIGAAPVVRVVLDRTGKPTRWRVGSMSREDGRTMDDRATENLAETLATRTSRRPARIGGWEGDANGTPTDGESFDRLAKAMATGKSRRLVAKGLVGGALAAVFGLRRAAPAGAVDQGSGEVAVGGFCNSSGNPGRTCGPGLLCVPNGTPTGGIMEGRVGPAGTNGTPGAPGAPAVMVPRKKRKDRRNRKSR